MFTVDLANVIFLLCLLVGGGLMLVSIVIGEVGDLASGIGLDLEIAGVGIVPPLLGFVALFGAGGLIGTQSLHLDSVTAAYVGLGAGIVGFGGVFGLLRYFRRSESGPEFRLESLVGATGRLTAGVHPGSPGEVELRAMGAQRRFAAHAESELPSGALVTVAGVAGDTLIVVRAGG